MAPASGAKYKKGAKCWNRIEKVTADGIATNDRMTELEIKVFQLAQELDAHRKKGNIQQFEKKIEEMSTQLAEQRTKMEQSPSVSTGSSSSNTGNPAYETRTAAILMRLLPPTERGQILTDDDRKARMEACYKAGKEVLLQCGVLESTHTNIASMPNAKGCTLDSTSHAALQLARSRVAATGLSFGTEPGGR